MPWHPFPWLSFPVLTAPLSIAVWGPSLGAPPPHCQQTTARGCAPRNLQQLHICLESPSPRSRALSVRGRLQRATPRLLRSPQQRAGTRPLPPRWSSRKRRRAAGRWLRSGRSSCGTRGRTSSWGAPGRAGVRGAGAGKVVADRSVTPLGRRVPRASPQLPCQVPGVQPPLSGFGSGGARISGLISLTGRCGGGESRSLPPARPPAEPPRAGGRGLCARVRATALPLRLRPCGCTRSSSPPPRRVP